MIGLPGDAQQPEPAHAAQARQRQDDGSGLTRFEPEVISVALSSSFFGHYCEMALSVEVVPVKLAQWAEMCPCHAPAKEMLASLHHMRSVMDSHFRGACSACPMSGKMAPELATGKLTEVALEVWSEQEIVMRTLPVCPGATPLTADQRDALMNDFEHGKSVVMALLELKTSYWELLPWSLCGLAATDCEKARAVAAKVLRQWESDPRPEAHHWLTVRLMPREAFVADLRRLASGVAYDTLSLAFREQVAVFRFIPTVETTVEEKHARVAQARKRHYISPVRVSMMNRMPLLERLILKQALDIPRFLQLFTEVGKPRLLWALMESRYLPGVAPGSLRLLASLVALHDAGKHGKPSCL